MQYRYILGEDTDVYLLGNAYIIARDDNWFAFLRHPFMLTKEKIPFFLVGAATYNHINSRVRDAVSGVPLVEQIGPFRILYNDEYIFIKKKGGLRVKLNRGIFGNVFAVLGRIITTTEGYFMEMPRSNDTVYLLHHDDHLHVFINDAEVARLWQRFPFIAEMIAKKYNKWTQREYHKDIMTIYKHATREGIVLPRGTRIEMYHPSKVICTEEGEIWR